VKCNLPPRGWWCSLEAGHDGPCPARPKWWNRSRFARIGRRYPGRDRYYPLRKKGTR